MGKATLTIKLLKEWLTDDRIAENLEKFTDAVNLTALEEDFCNKYGFSDEEAGDFDLGFKLYNLVVKNKRVDNTGGDLVWIG